MVDRNSERESDNLKNMSREPLRANLGHSWRDVGAFWGWEGLRCYVWRREVCSQWNYSLKVPKWVGFSFGRARSWQIKGPN